MDRGTFYLTFFNNLPVFFGFALVAIAILYKTVNLFSVCKGPLDPAHFYISFTFGTAYSMVFGLAFLGGISFDKWMLIFIYGVVLFVFVGFFSKVKNDVFYRVVQTFIIPKWSSGKFEFMLALSSYAICALITIYLVGFGLFADTNRFEQNRGIGVFVRITDCLRLFIIPYLYLTALKIKKQNTKYLVFFLIFVFAVFSSTLNGSKFSLLESIYAIFIATVLSNANFKVNFFKLTFVFIFVLAFALYGYQVNLENNGLSSKSSEYINGSPFLIEALFLRVLANGDKYFLSLPNDIIDTVISKSAILSILSPVIGSTRMSSLVGFNMNDFTIGKQILLYWDPSFSISGGPTSHFDLFAYVHFGLLGGVVFVALIGSYLGSVIRLSNKNRNQFTIFKISFIALLWLRSLPIIIEPPLGIAYIVDIFVIFTCFKFFGLLFKRQRGQN